MKVLFLTSWYPTSENPTAGIFVREHALASQCFNEVQVLHIFCRPASNWWGTPRLSLVAGDDNSVPVTHAYIDLPDAYRHGIGDFLCAALAVRAVHRLPFLPNLIHCNITLPGGLAALWLKRTMGVPVVLTEHGGDYQVFYGGSRATRFKAQFVLRRMDAILPVAKGQEETMRLFCPGGRYTVVPNAVDTNLFRVGGHQGSKDQIHAIAVGSLIPVKGHEFLLRAYAALPDHVRKRLRIVIVGDGPLYGSLSALRTQLQVEDGVHFETAGQPKSAIANLMQQSDFMVHPSLREGNPCVVIEAMSCGIPVLATRCNGSEYVVTPESGMLVEKRNVESLANGLQAMVENIHRYDNAEISRQAHAKYSYGSIGKQFDEVYRSVVARG